MYDRVCCVVTSMETFFHGDCLRMHNMNSSRQLPGLGHEMSTDPPLFSSGGHDYLLRAHSLLIMSYSSALLYLFMDIYLNCALFVDPPCSMCLREDQYTDCLVYDVWCRVLYSVI